MHRSAYKMFTPGHIGELVIKNRLVRSATADLILTRQLTDRVVSIYRKLAEGGVGLIITGELPIGQEPELRDGTAHYTPLWFDGVERIAETVHQINDDCRIVAQIGAEAMGLIGSDYPGQPLKKRVPDTDEFRAIVDGFALLILKLKQAGFDGVQLHGAHGYFLCSLLSPYSNRRTDEYGGSMANRVRIIRQIVNEARQEVGRFPILIKAPCDDFVEGGLSAASFPELAETLVACGVDAVEISTGVNPHGIDVMAAHASGKVPYESHARNLDLGVPIILVGGVRDAEKAEALLAEGTTDFVSMCRPFICEPDLALRWLEGRGSSKSGCIDCGCCRPSNYYDYGIVNECVYKHHPSIYKEMKKAK